MIYEVRTYTLRAGAIAEFEERYEKRLPARLKHSPLGAFWHTEFGPLNQVVHVYPYDDLQHRTPGARRARGRPRAQRDARRPGPDRGAGGGDHEPGAVHARRSAAATTAAATSTRCAPTPMMPAPSRRCSRPGPR